MQTYPVVASNASGNSAPASANVTWRNPPPPPVCSLFVTANSDLPAINNPVLLTASCNGTPSGYSWSGCASTSNLCYANSAAAGLQTYSVTAGNAGGRGPAGVRKRQLAGQPFGAAGIVLAVPQLPVHRRRLVERDHRIARFRRRPRVRLERRVGGETHDPANATGTHTGRIGVVEFGGPPTPREVTLSRIPCDFRAVDPSGNNGPLLRDEGVGPTDYIVLGASSGGATGLTPGDVYYYNVRNWQFETSSISCNPAIRRCEALVTIVVPH